MEEIKKNEASYSATTADVKLADENDEECGKEASGTVRYTRPMTPYERTRAWVYGTGNKWAIENFEATH